MREKFDEKDLRMIQLVMHHYSDYLMGDDRPDHGWGKMKRENFSEKSRQDITSICANISGKAYRMQEKMRA